MLSRSCVVKPALSGLNNTRTSRGRLWWGAAALVAALGVVAGCSPGAESGGESATEDSTESSDEAEQVEPAAEVLTPADVLDEYIAAWTSADWPGLAAVVFDASQDPAGVHGTVYDSLQVSSTAVQIDDLAIDGRRATAAVVVTLTLDRLGDWTYPTAVELIEVDGQWSVEWEPATLYPGLREGRQLQRLRVWPERGTLLAWDGTPLRADLPVRHVGIEPRRIEDRPALLVELADLVDTDDEAVAAALDAPDVQPDWFVPVVTLRVDEYRQIEAQLDELAGIVIQEGTDRLGPTDGYAQQVLGATGPITAEQLERWGEPYDSTSRVGRSGLELTYEADLAGTPTGEIRLLDASGMLLSVVERFAGRTPVDVRTSLDIGAQAAAEAALEAVSEPAALVAIDSGTGEVRAVVSSPSDDFGRAIAGAYPPGSTFKTIAAAAFLAAGGDPSSSVSCPPTVVVTGLPFTNAGGLALGPVSLQTAYAASCNTAFVNVATTLDEGALAEAARDFGFGAEYSIGLNTAGGSLPPPIDNAELAASAIGQARVTASPLHMATVAAAVADGTWRPPLLVLDPAPESTVEPVDLGADVTAGLQQMMRTVVTSGTGAAVSGAGGDISGKTGSAEFGEDDPPKTHAWFIGYRDGLAFAVLVEGGGAGGSVAAPIAANFLAALGS